MRSADSARAIPGTKLVARRGVRLPSGAGAIPAPSPTSRYRSKLEAKYAQHLDIERHLGTIEWWSYEQVSIRLPGKRNFYNPDFAVWDGLRLHLIEVKGSNDRSLVKIKTAAGICPWARFLWMTWKKGWQEREILP
jgi:hypothetical protein